MDNLLAGTLFSLSMEFQCRVIVQRRRAPLLLACGKHSAPSRTPFRQAKKLFAFPPESVFIFRPECCSESQRNRVRLHTGIAFTFDRIPHEDLEKTFKSSVDSQDRVNLASAVKKLKNFDDLDVVMGGKENSQRLISRLEDELKHQQTMRSRYSAAQKAVKYGAIGIGLGELSNIMRDLLGH
jgi:hypothetical protein